LNAVGAINRLLGTTNLDDVNWAVKPGPHQQQCRSNIVKATGNFVASCCDIVALFGNIVEATFDFVETTFDFVAFDNIASTLLVVWTGLIVIIRFRLPPELLMTPHITPPADRRGRGRPWRMDTKFWR